MKEGRATLMGLHRAVAGSAGHGHRFRPLTDNMSSLLAFDRGRSCSYDLLCLCRRAAALCIGADVSWTWRHGVIPRTKGLDEPLVLVVRGFCGALPSHLRLNMFLELWVFRFVSTQSRQIERSKLRPILAALALSLSFVRDSLLLLSDEAPMSPPAAT